MFLKRKGRLSGFEPRPFCLSTYNALTAGPNRLTTGMYVSKYTWCLTSTETIRLIRDGAKGGKGVWRWGEEGDYIPVAIHCLHHNDFFIKIGSDESRLRFQ